MPDDTFSAMRQSIIDGAPDTASTLAQQAVASVVSDPRAGFVQLERCIFLRHLLHAYQDFQE